MLLAQSPALRAEDVMIVGAHCRDILRSALGQRSGERTTEDIDFGLALAGWGTYNELAQRLEPAGDTGIRYRVANVPTDLMPFGKVENPAGTVTPPARRDQISVWGFTEVFRASRPLPLPSAGTIRVPTIAGYATLKLAAWLDRSAYGQYKDAADIATVLYWYSELPDVDAFLYDTEDGQDILAQEESDYPVAAARVLGQDIAAIIGSTRLSELVARWPGSREDSLFAEMAVSNVPGWPRSPERRRQFMQGLRRGLSSDAEG
ncbi:hypothetical protein HH310_06865 [Actinoplanes sp. TBRC 11911]|uniref:hypothetical protein n=1 Tax=Actinoplanes sp. TBRC 11911 TaxID=2729386 RepID=UPI00145D5DE5|nr:hypothetical protein [Actinoplanes sp. TBRC 11911]NMO50913.1 hypothetical protein [Actinoplanes sp. TBRC 11911]